MITRMPDPTVLSRVAGDNEIRFQAGWLIILCPQNRIACHE